jgi:hypothetical protein
MNLVARSLLPILYRCSSVGYTNLSLRTSTESSAPYFSLAFICTESRPYGSNLIIHELITAILRLAEEILHELASPSAYTTDTPHSHCARYPYRELYFGWSTQGLLNPVVQLASHVLLYPSGGCLFYIASMSIDIIYNQPIHARMSLAVGLEYLS